MKKKKILLLVLAFFMTFVSKVYALDEEDKKCSAISYNELRTQAGNVKISYIEEYETELTENEPEDSEASSPEEVPYLKIKIYNLTSKLYIKAKLDNIPKDMESPFKDKIFTIEDVGPDGSITIKQKPTSQVLNYTFTIMSDEYGCSGKTLRTVKITLPMFNYYSKLSICQDIPEYYLCKKYVTFDPSDNPEFEKKVNEYKATLEKQREENKKENDDNTISSTLESVSKYKYVVVGVVVAIGVVVTVLILRRKRSDK